MIRLVLAEDHALVRDGLRLVISVQPDLQLVAETDDGACVLALVEQHRPDVLLLDMGLPSMDGASVLAALAERRQSTRTLVVTARSDSASMQAALSLGAAGYVIKNERSDDLLEAIRKVHAGDTYISPGMKRMQAQPQLSPSAVTQREMEILRLVAVGLSSKTIGARLQISDLTVRKHRENLCRKLGVRNAAELVAMAVRVTQSPASAA